ncbi:AAA family ATPase [Cohnella massiliensis]|uniref:AAA family ATPase n=1 Tax=Cohnella massiliensis TaxID=1816691 RepID=UPI001FEBF2D3|nr:P-loop NTPase [Cohnella massiliensis]
MVLFRPNQHRRKAWIERLQKSGCDVRFVHDSERMPGETDLVVIDTAVGRWKDYVRLLKGQGIPIVLLSDRDENVAEDELAALGAAGIVTEKEEPDRALARFLRFQESGPSDPAGTDAPASFPSYGRMLESTAEASGGEEPQQAGSIRDPGLSDAEPVSEQGHRPDAGKTLSQRKAARQRLAERPSVKITSAVHEDPAAYPEKTPLQDNVSAMPAPPEVGDREPRDSQAEGQTITTDEESTRWTSGLATPVRPQSPPPPTPQRSRELPSIAAVYAAKGGVGKTTFVLHLAALLAKEGCRVCVLDLDLMHGTVASMLRIQPHKTIVDLACRIDDPKASRACLLSVKMGFSIVAAPSQPGMFRMEAEQLPVVLRFLKEETDLLLIDTPAHFDAGVKLALEQADLLMLMTTDEPASVESLLNMKPFIDRLHPSPEIVTVWNRLVERELKEQWREQLPWGELLELPEDPTVGQAVRSGTWIASSPVSPYRLRIKQLADHWMGLEPERPDPGRRLLKRWFLGRPG